MRELFEKSSLKLPQKLPEILFRGMRFDIFYGYPVPQNRTQFPVENIVASGARFCLAFEASCFLPCHSRLLRPPAALGLQANARPFFAGRRGRRPLQDWYELSVRDGCFSHML